MSQVLEPDLKIIDLINGRKIDGAPFTSIEYFPPRTEDGVKVRDVVNDHSKESKTLKKILY